MTEMLEKLDIQVVDLTGRAYDAGMVQEVIEMRQDVEMADGHAIVEETVAPTITWRGQVVHRGQIIVKRSGATIARVQRGGRVSNTIEYGIDLGTTNSCIARCEGDAIRVFQNNDQMNVTPSAVHILKSGRTIVGRRGHAALLTDPDNVAVEFKRWMGQKDRKRFPASQRELSAEELSAEILKSLREDVRRQTGTDVRAAVVTVPAAFGALQCEATARAAALAGFEEAPLLQEPIAAAIGYGTSQASSNQRWLVFDLGGGTLDIAVVSTREGRLNILEHRGNNLLGGKDIDRAIVEQVLLPALQGTYDLRASGPNSAQSRLLPRLRIKAEEAKIDLSTDAEVVISLFDIGEDDSDTPIELDVPFTRAQLEALMEPLVEKCSLLAQEALAGARVTGADLDRILLVGGPTQSPFLRSMLSTRLGAPIDFSTDPMTVVGRGAALYASTLERTNTPVPTRPASCLHLKLAYEPVSAEPECIVAGRVTEAPPDLEMKIESEGGLWTSGWMKVRDGFFETPCVSQDRECHDLLGLRARWEGTATGDRYARVYCKAWPGPVGAPSPPYSVRRNPKCWRTART